MDRQDGRQLGEQAGAAVAYFACQVMADIVSDGLHKKAQLQALVSPVVVVVVVSDAVPKGDEKYVWAGPSTFVVVGCVV